MFHLLKSFSYFENVLWILKDPRMVWRSGKNLKHFQNSLNMLFCNNFPYENFLGDGRLYLSKVDNFSDTLIAKIINLYFESIHCNQVSIVDIIDWSHLNAACCILLLQESFIF